MGKKTEESTISRTLMHPYLRAGRWYPKNTQKAEPMMI